MSTTAAAATTRQRRWVPVLVAVVVLLLTVALIGPASGPGTEPPLDPSSAAHDGLLGLVEILEELDVEVEVSTTPPEDADARAYLPVDLLTDDDHAAWRDWVEDGGLLVVGDHWSRLHDRAHLAPTFAERMIVEERSAACPEIPSEVGPVIHDDWGGVAYEPGEIDCYVVDSDHSWLVATEVGAGRIVLLGSSTPFTNAWLEQGDNALLAAALFGPRPGERLVVIPRSPAGDVSFGLLDLVPDGVWRALILLGLAIVVAVVARARRLGRPVEERLPPVLPSAELASSLAGLSRRAGDRGGAADQLRARARATIARTLGMGPDAPPHDLVERFAATSRLDRSEIELAFVDGPVIDDTELLQVSEAVARVLHEAGVGASVTAGRHAPHEHDEADPNPPPNRGS